ncbi:MAG: GNAT family N-acetyltransferase, partial [Terracidiphilus sp.]
MSDPAGEVRIRPMAASDLDRVLEIADSLNDAPYWPRAAYLTALSQESTPKRIALVATGLAPEDVRGFLVAVLTPPEADLESIGIATAFQRRGIGRVILQALVDDLGRTAIQRLYLEVRSSHATALAFYRGFGFA